VNSRIRSVSLDRAHNKVIIHENGVGWTQPWLQILSRIILPVSKADAYRLAFCSRTASVSPPSYRDSPREKLCRRRLHEGHLSFASTFPTAHRMQEYRVTWSKIYAREFLSMSSSHSLLPKSLLQRFDPEESMYCTNGWKFSTRKSFKSPRSKHPVRWICALMDFPTL